MKLGATIVSEPSDLLTMTHIAIITNTNENISRSVKVMIGASKTPHIVHFDWIGSSYKHGSFLPCKDFLIHKTHAGKAFEQKHNFSFEQTFKNASAARKTGGILQGVEVHFCRGVCGGKMPSAPEFGALVKSAGATQVRTLYQAKSFQNLIIITSHPETKAQEQNIKNQQAVKNGARKISVREFFDIFVHQHVPASVFEGQNGRTAKKVIQDPPQSLKTLFEKVVSSEPAVRQRMAPKKERPKKEQELSDLAAGVKTLHVNDDKKLNSKLGGSKLSTNGGTIGGLTDGADSNGNKNGSAGEQFKNATTKKKRYPRKTAKTKALSMSNLVGLSWVLVMAQTIAQ